MVALGWLVTSIILLALLFYVSRYRYKHISQLKSQLIRTQNELNELKQSHQAVQQELRVSQDKIRMAAEDPVTHLSSWSLFTDRLNQSLKESARYHLTMGIIMVDIDDFNVINDGLSQAMGDKLLQEVAERLKLCIRQVDSISRMTKDTFVILLTQLAKPETAAIVVQRMLASLEEPFILNDKEWYITACVGVSIYPHDGQEAAVLLRNADYALQIAKQKGKQIYQFYEEKMHATSCHELTLYNSLRRDSVFQEFIPYYQPIRNMQTQAVFCMDTQLHWLHPELGEIDSEQLQQYALRQHRLNAISAWLIKKACQQFLDWQTQNSHLGCLGIPLSITQLESSHFICHLSQILQDLSFKPEWLLLEIYGHAEALSFDVLEKSFNRLKYLGIKLAFNFFGWGSFSLVHFKNVGVDFLKLDPALIDHVVEDQQEAAMVQAIFHLAASISAQVIVQGVESPEQIAVLKTMGYFLMQGPGVGEALVAADVTRKIVTIT